MRNRAEEGDAPRCCSAFDGEKKFPEKLGESLRLLDGNRARPAAEARETDGEEDPRDGAKIGKKRRAGAGVLRGRKEGWRLRRAASPLR